MKTISAVLTGLTLAASMAKSCRCFRKAENNESSDQSSRNPDQWTGRFSDQGSYRGRQHKDAAADNLIHPDGCKIPAPPTLVAEWKKQIFLALLLSSTSYSTPPAFRDSAKIMWCWQA